jgi:starch synthase
MKKRILMVSPEVTPWASAGGLGDVAGALPKALSALGHDVRVIMPKHGSILPEPHWIEHKPLTVTLGNGVAKQAKIWETVFPDKSTKLYLLDHEPYFGRKEIYAGSYGNHSDNHERFAFFNRASLDLCYALDWIPDVIHCHDWTTGLIPIYLNTTDREKALGQTATVFTIHNLQHQGIFHKSLLDFAGIPHSEFRQDSLECLGSVNLMKGGLYHATKLTTVSPSYAKEIQTPAYGCGLNDVLKFRAADLIGILNGMDTTVWNPHTDASLPKTFSAKSLSGKRVCKAELQKRMGLASSENIALFSVVTRLYDQKGIDLLAELMPKLLDNKDIQIAILGSGEAWLENKLRELAKLYPKKLGVFIGYDSALSHLLLAGADFFVMPSRFEPCGLTQMYAMTYGTPPIVRETGGLIDTVEQYQANTPNNVGTGFIFEEPTAAALYEAIEWACTTYQEHPKDYKRLQINGMKKDFSWKVSAQHYDNVYDWAIETRSSGINRKN